MTTAFHRLGLLLLTAGLLAGCRTYGAYDNEEATLRQIEQVREQAGQTLARRQADLRALNRLGDDPHFAAASTVLDDAIAEHMAMLSRHDALVEEAMDHPSNYRVLHNTYGTLVAEHRVMEERYDRIFSYLARTVELAQMDSVQVDSMRHAQMIEPDSRHQVAPPFFERIRFQAERTMESEILMRTRQDQTPTAPGEEETE